MRALWGIVSLMVAASACANKPNTNTTEHGNHVSGTTDATHGAGPPPVSLEPSERQKQLAAMDPAKALPPTDVEKQLGSSIDAYFAANRSHRIYVALDKPLYQPGESIWFRSWELATADLASRAQDGWGTTYQLISPKGAVVLQKRVQVQRGVSTNDFIIPFEVPGGEYTLQVTSDTGATAQRKLIVSTYQPPQIKKKLELTRKAYGPGDEVSAAIALHRGTGEPLASFTATALVVVDGQEVARAAVTTDAEGKGIARFRLPEHISAGDGLLTILVDDGGITESIQKRIPITLDKLQVAVYPEGGDLVTGLPGRVYFLAKNTIDKPADIEGRVVDDRGTVVASFASLHNGMGRFEIVPASGRTYHLEIDKPVGITTRVELPAAKEHGCSLQAIDDFDSDSEYLKVAVWCSEAKTVVATAVLRERRLDAAAIELAAGEPSVVALLAPATSQGAVRVTVFDDELRPLAERLVYRGRGNDLKVTVRADKASYSPRDKVELEIETRDLAGKPVSADVAIAVVDDTVLNFADDKTATMLASLYLESEMPGQIVEEPNFYFGDDPKAAAALDLVLGTQGWRRFEWQLVLQPVVTATIFEATEGDGYAFADEPAEPEAEPAPPPVAAPKPADKKVAARKPAAPRPQAAMPMGGVKGKRDIARNKDGERARREAPAPDRGVVARGRVGGGAAGMDAGEAVMDEDMDWAGAEKEEAAWAWAPVRVFPTPSYEGQRVGPRTDFRETVFWKPDVTTGKDGKAVVSFYLSDAVTSFRATAEGVSRGGLPGRGDMLVTSKLPVSLAVKMPLEVSAGDTIRLPVTLINETDESYTAALRAEFGNAFKLTGHAVPATVKLKAGERKSFFYQLEVVGNGKEAAAGKMKVSIEADDLTDEMERTIKVVPLGFPQEMSLAGTLDGAVKHEVDLGGALPNTMSASLTLYPSPLATMTKGTEAIIREPYGCFEQASSANYPNIMVLSYMEEHDAADPDLLARTHATLERGYGMLAGYESPQKGYEWFGGDPGHEALTAYGLMEFVDMTKVYDDVDRQMIARTSAWLMKRRDGKGGYLRNDRALDSFGRASAEVTNGYITWALTEAGERDLDAEIGYQRNIAKTTSDPYLLALATNVLLNVEPDAPGTSAAVKRLVAMQAADGSFPGADHSITRSGGGALTVETTSLAAMAMIKAGPAHLPQVREAVAYLDSQRSGWGGFYSTQSTVLSLRAMSAYAKASRKTQSAGSAEVWINGKRAGKVKYEAGHSGALVFDDLDSHLVRGKNTIEIKLDSKDPLPYSMAITWRTRTPASSPETVTRVRTKLARAEVPMGESVRMSVTVENTSAEGIPMTMARVGLPGGLTFQTWQLKELRDKKLIDFYETREREVILYFRSMPPKDVKNLELDLKAEIPGSYIAPASSAYLYYTDEYKHWAEPVRVVVTK